MKKLVALLAVLSYVPFAHAAEGDWTHNGEFRLQYFNNAHSDFNDKNGGSDQNFHQRTKVGTTVRAGEKMTFNLGLLHNADWGTNGTTNQYPSTFGGNNGLTVHEANAVWQASDVMTWKFGRISHTIADGSVVDMNSWENVPKAFDGVGMVYELEPVRLTAFGVTGSKAEEQGAFTQTNTFGRFFGVSADIKTLPAFLKMANVHYIITKRDQGAYADLNGDGAIDADPANDEDVSGKENVTRMGFTVGGDTAGVDYKFTYAMMDGEDEYKDAGTTTKTDIAADMMDLEVGYSMPEMMNFRVWAGYHTDSGDNDLAAGKAKTYKPFHYEQHNNAGRMDVVGWGNLTYTRIGATIAPQESLTVGAEYFMFTTTDKKDAVYADNATGTTNFGGGNTANNSIYRIKSVNLTGANYKDDIGTELDVWVTKKYTNNFSITGRFGQFDPGKALAQNGDVYQQLYLEGKLTF